MCEIAVKKFDNDLSIPKEQRWCAGDIVAVCSEGHPWTEKERTHFDIVILPGILVEEAMAYCQEANPMDENGRVIDETTTLRRSRYKLDKVKRCFCCKLTDSEYVLEDLVINAGGDPEKMQTKFRKPNKAEGKK
ncbi:hypothetical protein KAR91_49980 [Candidatus Pacearchaeota archaeon]|nr:hypothetical protein [Candidatus Pacearchaeota archaeon]